MTGLEAEQRRSREHVNNDDKGLFGVPKKKKTQNGTRKVKSDSNEMKDGTSSPSSGYIQSVGRFLVFLPIFAEQ